MTQPAETSYFAAGWDYGEELARLRLLEATYDEGTRLRLVRLGVGAGWRCLDVGAGAGSVARWLAEQVGPTGSVVAADLDPRFLGEPEVAGLANLTVRAFDIRTDPPDPSAYDLVHSRALLMHLADPGAAVATMAAALRPGGWLLVEEPDFVAMVAASEDHPDAALFDSLVRRMADYQRRYRDYDPHAGRKLPGLLDRAGLVDVGNEGSSMVVRGGEPRARLFAESRRRSTAAYLADGVATERELARFERALHDPAFAYLEYVLVAGWGRRAGR